MDIEELTLKQLREISAMFNGLPPIVEMATLEAQPSMLAVYIGQHVVVRDQRAGVFCGLVEHADGNSVRLAAGARQSFYWTGAGACMGLATTGPSGGKITAPSVGPIPCLDVIGIYPCTPEALSTWAAQPTWSGR